jgi:hypothetical protein
MQSQSCQAKVIGRRPRGLDLGAIGPAGLDTMCHFYHITIRDPHVFDTATGFPISNGSSTLPEAA